MNKHTTHKWGGGEQGFSLVEVLLSIALFAVVTLGLVSGMLMGQESGIVAGNRMRATLLAQGGVEIVRNIKEGDFALLGDMADGVHYLLIENGVWGLGGDTAELFHDDFFEREIETEVLSSNVVEVIARVRWQQNHKRTGVVEVVTRFANWLESLWVQTTEQDFDAGFENSVQVVNNAGGEVTLAFEGAWDEPSVLYAWDMVGSHDARAIVLHENELWVARSTNPASEELYVVSLADIDAVGDRNTPAIEESFEIGFTATGLVVEPEDRRAYASTANNSNDVVLVNLDDTASNTIIDLEGMATTTDILKTPDGKVVVSMRNNNGGAEVHVLSSSLSGVYGKVEVGGNANALAYHDGYVYVATSLTNELGIVDYNDCLGELEGYACSIKWYDVPESSGELTALEVQGDLLYVGRNNGYVHIVDISDAFDPSHDFSVDTGSAGITGIAPDEENGAILVSTDGASTKEVLVIDTSNSDVVSIDLVGAQRADDIIRYGNLAYAISRDNEEIQVLQGGTGGWVAPQFVDDDDIPGGANGREVFYRDGYSYVAVGSVLYIYSIAQDGTASLAGTYPAGFDLNDVAAQGDYIYLATTHNAQELLILDASDPTNPQLVPGGVYNTEGGSDAGAVWVDGPYAYLGTKKNGGTHASCSANADFYVIDVSNPGAPLCVGSEQVGRNVRDIEVAFGHAYAATNQSASQVVAIDVGDPSSPQIVDRYDTRNSANAVFVSGERLFVGADDASSRADLFVFDISAPSQLVAEVVYDSGERINSLVADGEYVFTVSHINDAFRVFDITDPNSVRFVSGYTTGAGCIAIAWDGVRAHLSCDNNAQEYVVLGPQAAPDSYTTEGWFTSEAFDSGNSGTRWSAISWGRGGAGVVGIQLRTAPDSGGSPGVWGRWLGPGGIGTMYDDPLGGEVLPSAHRDGSGDQWIQYRVYLEADNGTPPIFQDITIQF